MIFQAPFNIRKTGVEQDKVASVGINNVHFSKYLSGLCVF